MKRLLLITLMALGFAGGAQATLVGRDVNGNAVIQRSGDGALDSSAVFLYDDVLNVTWLRDANYAKTQGYATATRYGDMGWGAAKTWAANLTVGSYGGWRLPTMIDTGRPGADFGYGGTDSGFNVLTTSGSDVYSEMASLWYDTLGNEAPYNTSGAVRPNWGVLTNSGWSGLTNSGAFQNLQSERAYWSGLEYAPNTIGAWIFNTVDGLQDVIQKPNSLYALAVRPGDVQFAMVVRPGDGAPAAVPIPAALPLLLSGLAALGVAGRRRGRGRVEA